MEKVCKIGSNPLKMGKLRVTAGFENIGTLLYLGQRLWMVAKNRYFHMKNIVITDIFPAREEKAWNFGKTSYIYWNTTIKFG